MCHVKRCPKFPQSPLATFGASEKCLVTIILKIFCVFDIFFFYLGPNSNFFKPWKASEGKSEDTLDKGSSASTQRVC